MQPWSVARVPEEAALSSRALLDYLYAVQASGMEHHSVMIYRRGLLAASMQFAPHTADEPHICYSLSKPFTSLAAGFAVSEGLLSYDSRVLDVLADAAPSAPDPWLQQVTLHHLLSMSSGLAQRSDNLDHIFRPDACPGEDWARAVLACGCDAEPGTCFRYNSHGSYLVSCMVQRVTGTTVSDYLMPRVFEPLGIPRPRWDMSPQGVCCGGWGLYLSCESLLRFGVCLLHGGRWQGRALLPGDWYARATQVQIDTAHRTPAPKPEWAQGYGYHLWRCTGDRFRGDGSNGQFLIVSPAQDMAVARTADLTDMPAAHELLNTYLFDEARQQPADAATQEAFLARAGALGR